MPRSVYLDYNATAPVRPAAAAAVSDALSLTGNASSVHRYGRLARRMVEEAREAVAALVGVEPEQVVFTSGGTEANNLALNHAAGRRILVSAGEHDSILQAVPDAERIPLMADGVVDIAALADLVAREPCPALVSVMLANNETGVLQPVAEAARLAHGVGACLHCDAVQAAGKMPVDFGALEVDLLSLSAHKLGGPQGVGALIVRDGMDLPRLLHGGGQERRRRPGTENLPGIAGFGAAAREAGAGVAAFADLAAWRDALEAAIKDLAPQARIFGSGASRLPNTSCFTMPGVRAETQVMALDLAGVAVSAGSACSSGKVQSSHVLRAMGADEETADSAIRVSLGWASAREDLDSLLQVWSDLLQRAGVGHREGATAPATAGVRREVTVTERPIYLDYQATTPADPRVVEAMLPFFGARFGNPHSVHHVYGAEAAAAVEAARAQIAALINADPREIVFTSGATEANNLALKGVAWFHKLRRGITPHVITAATEHKCVLESCRRLEAEGVRVTYLAVEPDGLVDLARLEAALEEDTVLVSIMAANNEIGVVQPIARIGELCRSRGVAFHSDAAQAVGKLPVDVQAAQIDLMSVSGHKIYGPMGIGVLYVRRRPRVRLEPLFDGGGQERGLRSGTLPLPLCVGLGVACALAQEEMEAEAARLMGLRRRLLEGVRGRLSDVHLNGNEERRLPGNLNLSFTGLDAERLIAAMPGLAVSTGSACTSASVEPSYVLRALGLPDDLAGASVRFGLGRFTSEAEVDAAIEQIAAAVTRLRGATQAAE